MRVRLTRKSRGPKGENASPNSACAEDSGVRIMQNLLRQAHLDGDLLENDAGPDTPPQDITIPRQSR